MIFKVFRDPTRWTLLFVLSPLIFVSYFGTLAVAVSLLPKGYDWRYRAISKLLYPRNNPQFHSIPSVGIAVTGVLIIPFAGYAGRRLRVASPIGANVGGFVFGAGAVCLILAGLIVSDSASEFSGFPRLHEMLARASALGIGAGMLVFDACALKGYFVPATRKKLYRRGLLVSWNLLILPAILVVVLRLAAHADFRWSNPIYHALKNPAAWHLAFWEWIGSAAVFMFLLSSALFLPERACECHPHGSSGIN
ncbi:MAG: hypothetical protein WA005_18295 [Candidatus Binataceae bacterium]